MESEERARKLATAERLILEVRNSFSNEKQICGCCGFEKFINFNDRQMREQLNGAVTRLRRVAERMIRTDGVVNHPMREDDD